MRYSVFLTYIFVVLVAFSAISQQRSRLDSLNQLLENELHDSVRLEVLTEISRFYNKDLRHLDRCEELLGEALIIASKDSNYTALSRVYHSYGVLYRNTAQYGKALNKHHESLKYAKKSGKQHLVSSAYNSIGVVYRRIENHPQATQYHLLGLKEAEAAGDDFNVAVSLNSLGNIYSLNGQYNEAFEYFSKALALAKKMRNTLGQAINYNNIGEVYEFMGVMDSALVYYNKSLEANQAINSQKGKAISYNAIGKVYLHYGRINEALNLFTQALKIDKKLGDKKFIADSYLNMGRALFALGNLNKAEEYTNNTLAIAKDIGVILHTQWALENLSNIYSKRNMPDTAFYLFRMASKYRDSLLNEKNVRAIAMMEVMYDIEKKQQEIQILKQTQEINEKELARQKTIRTFYFVAFIFALIIASIIFYLLNVKRRANKVLFYQKAQIEESNVVLNQQQQEILRQKQEIEVQRNNIEQKNRHLHDAYKVIEGYVGKITDSIRYAERIQKAILPPLSLTHQHFSDNFRFYRPKDFVTGDFYWLTVKEKTLFFAAGDCTGHGVPGAFMSIIGLDLLSQAVNQHNLTEPSAILNYINVELRNKLRKEEKEELVLKDSMDVAIFKHNLGDSFITYSGALIPLTIIRNQKIIEYKPDFASIGISQKLFSKAFNQQTIEIKKGDWIYLYSDGYMDQFGGESMKKFMKSNFLSTLIRVSTLSGAEQKTELEKTFFDWMGDGEQIDDVLVVGLKV